MPKAKRANIWLIVTLAITALFVFFFVYPVFRIFIASIYDSQAKTFSLDAFKKFFSRPYYTSTVKNSLVVTSVVTIIATIFGTFLAYVTRTVKIKGQSLVELIIIISILSPPFIGAYSWILLLGRSGTITKLIYELFGVRFGGIYGFGGIVLVFVIRLFPLIYLYVSGALKQVDNSLIEASETLGSVGIKKITTVTLPLILPTVLSAALIAFMRAFADFGTPMLIGEGYRTLPVLIYSQFVGEMGGDRSFASAISVIMIALTTAIFLVQKYVSSRMTIQMSVNRPIQPKEIKGWRNILAHAFVYLSVLVIALPQAVVIYTSFLKTRGGRLFVPGYSLDSYRDMFTKLGSSIINTYVYSAIAMAIILVIGVLVAYISVRKRNFLIELLDTLTMLPFIISGSVLGIALLGAFNKSPFLLSGTAAIIVVAYVIRRLPYTIRSSAAILSQIHPSVEDASRSLGASDLKTFRKVLLPIMGPGITSGAIMSWMSIISELSATVILYVGATKTLTIAIYTEVIRGNYGVGAALSTVHTLTTILALLVFFKITGKREIEL